MGRAGAQPRPGRIAVAAARRSSRIPPPEREPVSLPRTNYRPSSSTSPAPAMRSSPCAISAPAAPSTSIARLHRQRRGGETIYLRGVTEACHHSVVLKRTRERPPANAWACASSPRRPRCRQGPFRESPTAGGLGRRALPGPHLARLRPGRHAARVLRQHGREATPGRRVQQHQGACRSGSIISRSSCPTSPANARSISSMGFRLSEYIAPDGKRRTAVRLPAAQGQPARHRVRQRRRAALPSRRLRDPGIASLLLCLRSRSRAGLRPTTSNTVRAGMGPATHCSSISAIPTATASSCSTRTIR